MNAKQAAYTCPSNTPSPSALPPLNLDIRNRKPEFPSTPTTQTPQASLPLQCTKIYQKNLMCASIGWETASIKESSTLCGAKANSTWRTNLQIITHNGTTKKRGTKICFASKIPMLHYGQKQCVGVCYFQLRYVQYIHTPETFSTLKSFPL